MVDWEVTAIDDAPPTKKKRKRRGKPKKRKTDDTLTEKVGDESDARLTETDRTRVGDNTYVGEPLHPVKAALLSLFLWGAGFVYVGYPVFAALVILPVSLFLGATFAATSGILPLWIGEPFLEDLSMFDLELRTPRSALILGLLLTAVWWFSVVITTSIAKRTLPFGYESKRGRSLSYLFFPVPSLFYYLRGQFWRGHGDALLGMLLPVFFFSATSIWQYGPHLSSGESVVVSKSFAGALLGAGLSFGLLCFGVLGRVAAILKEVGIVRSREDGARAERKFVILGSGVILAVLLYVFAGRPGTAVRIQCERKADIVAAQGFPEAAERLRVPLRMWAAGAHTVHEYMGFLNSESPQ